jgi:hypothetical protein
MQTRQRCSKELSLPVVAHRTPLATPEKFWGGWILFKLCYGHGDLEQSCGKCRGFERSVHLGASIFKHKTGRGNFICTDF